jgi:4-diphosphocytidyl-2-C-methyl-D-erythritol kinase
VTGRALVLWTPAKVNPVLEVLSKRPDGYHELSLIFQAVSLFDHLSFTSRPEGVQLTVHGSSLAGDDSNLVVKAAKLFLVEVLQGKGGVAIELEKGIPLEAGMGGGSSDAAATLKGMDLLYGTGVGEEKLSELAARLGSDVPFFLTGGSAWGRGRGEKVTPLPRPQERALVLVKPTQGLSTPLVFRSGKFVMTDGKKAEAFASRAASWDDREWAGALFNGLEPATLVLSPETVSIKARLTEAGALGTLVSGSGPTVFGIAEGWGEAQRIADKMREPGLSVFPVKTLSTGIQVV